MTRRFVAFVEENDHEGETWTFWLQYDGNEEALLKFARLLDNADFGGSHYELTSAIESEPTVDKLVQYADHGYMASHNKVVGIFGCPDSIDPPDDYLYKGEIKIYFDDEELNV